MAVSCVNCDQDAVFLVADPGANPLDYCREHMPEHLTKRANGGHFTDSQSVKAKNARAKWHDRGKPETPPAGGKGKP